jgi:hypothetical protein
MSDMQAVYAALRKADAEGNVEDARRLSAYIREQEQEAPVVEQGDQYAAEREEMLQSNIDDMSTVEKGLVGAGRVVASGIEGVQDLYYGATGQEEKREELNRKADDDEAIYDELADRSTAVKVGNVLGEVGLGVATGVGVGGLYKGVRAAQVAGSISKPKAIAKTAGLLAAEGGVVEGLRNRGDALDRLVDAGEGAGMSVAGQGVLSGIGKGIGAVGRRIGSKVGREVFDETTPLLDDVAEGRKVSAREDGGFELDDVDAAVDRAGLARRDALRREASTEGRGLQYRHAEGERAITNKAETLIEDAAGGGQRGSVNAQTDAFADSLRELRADDMKSVDNAYNAWRATPEAADVKLDTSSIEDPIRKLLSDSRITSDGGVNSKLKALMKQYGVLTEESADVGTLKALSGGSSKSITTATAERPLTAANYEQLIMDINGLHSVGNNSSSKGIIGQVRNLLEESKYDLLAKTPGVSSDAIKLGEAARSSRKAFALKWEQGDIVDKLTSLKPGTEDFRAQPIDAVRALMAPKNLDKLKKVKNIVGLSKNPAHKQFLADIQAAPLFEAMDNALKGRKTAAGGIPMFSDHEFMKVIRKYSDDQLETLYGAGFVKKIGKAEKAWKLREAQPNWQSNANPSGTAETGKHLTAASLRLASTRGGGSDVLAAVPMFAGIKDILAKRATSKDLKLLLSGKLPAISEELREEAFTKIIKEAFPNPQFAQYDSVFSAMGRSLSRSYENNQFDD